MSFDLILAFETVSQTVQSGVSVAEGMAVFLDFCNHHCPDSRWNLLASHDWSAEAQDMERWFRGVLNDEALPPNIVALWFGINDIVRDSTPATTIYILGSDNFSPDDPDWACLTERSYFPEKRYYTLETLDRFLKTVRPHMRQEAIALAEYMLPLGYAALAVHSFANDDLKDEGYSHTNVRHVAVGFDDGDYINLY